MIYKFQAKVLAVEELKERFNYRKDGSYDEVATGWWSIRIEGSSAIKMREKPDFASGDYVELAIRRIIL